MGIFKGIVKILKGLEDGLEEMANTPREIKVWYK